MVLEALDKIREAEEKVETMRRQAKEELLSYEQQKSADFNSQQEKSQKKVAGLLQEFETTKTNELQKEKELLLNEAKTQDQEFREKYEKNKDSLIAHVIERVKKIYGSQ